MRQVVTCPPGGFGAQTIEGTSEQFCLSHPALLDERDVSTAEISESDQGRVGMTLHLKKNSLLKVREATENLVSGKVGYIINNRLMMVANVTSSLGSSVTVYGNFNQDELHSLVDRMNSEMHPQP